MTHTSTEQERQAPIKMHPGDDLHLTVLMASHGLNFVTGKDREQLLAWGRDVWQAARFAHLAYGVQSVPVAYELGDYRITRRSSAEDEQEAWAVLLGGMCLSKSGTYSYEPQPSSRTDAWLAQHRFGSAQEAMIAARKAQEKQEGA